MSNLSERNAQSIPELWEEILKRHWAYLETEENLQKLEERKRLEGCLKDFLCIVRHDRKFFLLETLNALSKLTDEMRKSDFNINRFISAFEAISQYATNLFTKPWRKEFRILKTYSGFYQHEIKANFIEAEKFFMAMGYRLLSEDVLILDGPICPDQVTNVSRDAMAAYVELQIIKQIHNGLESIGLQCTWLDILRFREKHVGNANQAIKSLAYIIHEHRFRNNDGFKSLNNNYGYIKFEQIPQGNVHHCNGCHCKDLKSASIVMGSCTNGVDRDRNSFLPAVVIPQSVEHGYMVPSKQVSTPSTSMYYNITYPQSNTYHYNYRQQQQQQYSHQYPQLHYHQPQLPQKHYNLPNQRYSNNPTQSSQHLVHSRSLDHYSETSRLGGLSYRHSFDFQPQDYLENGGQLVSSIENNGCRLADHYRMYHQHPQMLPSHGNHYEPIYNDEGIEASSFGDAGNSSIISYDTVGPNQGAYCSSDLTTSKDYSNTNRSNDVLINSNSYNKLTNEHSRVSKESCALGTREYLNEYGSVDKGSLESNRPVRHEPHCELPTSVPTYGTVDNVYSQEVSKSYFNTYSAPNSMVLDHYHPHHFQNAINNNNSHANHFNMNSASGASDRLCCSDGVDGNFTVSRLNLDYLRLGLPSAGVFRPNALLINGDNVEFSVNQKDRQQLFTGQLLQLDGNNYSTNTNYINNSSEHSDSNKNMLLPQMINNAYPLQSYMSTCGGRNSETANMMSPVDRVEKGMRTFECSEINYNDIMGNIPRRRRRRWRDPETSAFDGDPSVSAYAKDKDGVGSFELWNFVFKNLDQNSYNKELMKNEGDLPEMELRSLQLMELTKDESSTYDNKKRQYKHLDININYVNDSKSASEEEQHAQKKEHEEINEEKKITKAINVKTAASIVNATSKDLQDQSIQGYKVQSDGNLAISVKQKQTTEIIVQKQPSLAVIVATKGEEWSCRFCTFLNPDTKRICDACFHSKDFDLDAVPIVSAPTCV